jgi:hypothetical protein
MLNTQLRVMTHTIYECYINSMTLYQSTRTLVCQQNQMHALLEAAGQTKPQSDVDICGTAMDICRMEDTHLRSITTAVPLESFNLLTISTITHLKQFFLCSKHTVMDKVQRVNDPKCDTPLPESYTMVTLYPHS